MFGQSPRSRLTRSLQGRIRSKTACLNVERLEARDLLSASGMEQSLAFPVDPPNDTYYSLQWDMQGGFGSNAIAAWQAGYTGSSSVYVGVVDEGIQHLHTDLQGSVHNPGEIANKRDDDRNGKKDDLYGWDFYQNNNSVYDGTQDDHGTHVAGTIGANGNNGKGVAGISWDGGMISAKFLGPNGGSTSAAVSAINYLVDLKVNRGVNIVAINASWGGGGYSSSLRNAIQAAANANILFVAAAGNSGANSDSTAFYPAAYDVSNVISVAAIDQNGSLASWSNYGANTVDLGAPGVTIASTVPNSGYAYYSGTSMAAPHVTGAIALYAAKYPTATAAQIKAALLSSVVPTASLAGKTVTGGRLDIYAFLNTAPGGSASAASTGGGSGSGDQIHFKIGIGNPPTIVAPAEPVFVMQQPANATTVQMTPTITTSVPQAAPVFVAPVWSLVLPPFATLQTGGNGAGMQNAFDLELVRPGFVSTSHGIETPINAVSGSVQENARWLPALDEAFHQEANRLHELPTLPSPADSGDEGEQGSLVGGIAAAAALAFIAHGGMPVARTEDERERQRKTNR